MRSLVVKPWLFGSNSLSFALSSIVEFLAVLFDNVSHVLAISSPPFYLFLFA